MAAAILPVRSNAFLDRIAIGISALCVMHCIASAALLALLSTAAGVMFDESIHHAGLGIAIALGAVALGRGVMAHGYMMPVAVGSLGLGIMGGALSLHDSGEILWTIIGVALLALGHELNRRAVI